MRARSDAEFVSKMGGGHQELEEAAYWLELLSDAEIIKPELLEDLIAETNELNAIFTTCIKNARDKRKRRKERNRNE